MFSTPKVENGLINPSWSVPRSSVCLLLCTGDFFWLAGRHTVTSLLVSPGNGVSTKFVSMPVIRIQLLLYVEVSDIIDKLVDSISRWRQLWVDFHSVLRSSSLATFSRQNHLEYIGLDIHRRKCHAGWWATQLQYLSVIDLTGITHKLL